MSIIKDIKLSLGVLFLRKKKVFRTIFLIVLFCVTLIALIKINILNTKALSPLGNTNDNYKLVSEEFGEDFSNFIQDKSPVKIYIEEDEETMVRLGEKDFIIKSESNLINFAKGVFSKVEDLFN
ncbi:MAG: hypothetical protein KIC66_00980 [Clostridium sp.]|nr:hypothetical protein [Clostridium sp.]MBS5986794.1 hypothetical protein [Clostridium sp.]